MGFLESLTGGDACDKGNRCVRPRGTGGGDAHGAVDEGVGLRQI